MKPLILAAVLLLSAGANASTFYFMNGKEVSRAQVMRQLLNKPGTRVKRIKVDFIRLNLDTGRFKKTNDGTLRDLPK